jgi:hypothetical protein
MNYENSDFSFLERRSDKIQGKIAQQFSPPIPDFSVCSVQNGGAFQNASNYTSQ